MVKLCVYSIKHLKCIVTSKIQFKDYSVYGLKNDLSKCILVGRRALRPLNSGETITNYK